MLICVNNNLTIGYLRAPVISKLGITFDHDSILKWLKTKQLCPVTKQDLHPNELRPNKNVYNLINFIVLSHRYNIKHTDNPIALEEIL